MSAIHPINDRAPTVLNSAYDAAAQRARPAAESTADWPTDRAELSPRAAAEATRSESSSAADRRLAEIRQRIADDTYLTPEKLDAAVEGLLKDALRPRAT